MIGNLSVYLRATYLSSSVCFCAVHMSVLRVGGPCYDGDLEVRGACGRYSWRTAPARPLWDGRRGIRDSGGLNGGSQSGYERGRDGGLSSPGTCGVVRLQ